MAFFLLGRTVDGAISLLSSETFESRQDALAELGRITGEPAFSSWEDEVVLVDLDRGTPVLLVRPTAPVPCAEPDTAATSDAAPEPAAFAAIADDEPVVEPVLLEVPQPEAGIEIEVSEADEAVLTTIVAEVVGTDSESVTEPGADTHENDSGDAPAQADLGTGSDVPAEPEEAAQTVSEMDSLRDAIARTAEHMEASGIVAPISIAAADATLDEPAPDAAPEPELAPEAAEVAASPEPDESPAETTAGPWPWSTRPRETPDAEEPSPETAETPENPETADIDVAFLLEGLEEPSVDDGGSLITSSIDAASLAASRPMILGAYGESPSEPSAEVELAEAEAEADEVAAEVDLDVEPAETAEIAQPAEESDFILLESEPETVEVVVVTVAASSESADGAPEPTSSADDVLSLSAYTCDDCVYVETCPNKDQRRPQDCGSFQWK